MTLDKPVKNGFIYNYSHYVFNRLVYLIQEEKLARDVYMIMYHTRGIKKFYNILNAEENHQSLVADILHTYGINNPNTDKDIGEFADNDLQTLYTTLVQQGKVNKSQAIQVGIIIEKKDIKDLEDMMDLFSSYPDIQNILQKLLHGSKRHLAAFTQPI